MIFLDRGRQPGTGRFTALKVQLFFAGAAVLLAGMALGRDALVLLAIGILAVGVVLRFLDRPAEPEYAVDEDPEAADGAAPDDADPRPDQPRAG